MWEDHLSGRQLVVWIVLSAIAMTCVGFICANAALTVK